MKSYSGIYQDGHSPAGQPVTIQVQATGLALTFASRDGHVLGTPGLVFWEASRIKPNAYREGHKTVLRYGDTPVQSLEVVSPDFAEVIKNAFPEAVFHRNAQPLPKHRASGLYFLLALFLAGLALCYFFLLPAMADLLSRQIPLDTEIALGEKIYSQLVEKEKIDSARTQHAQGFLQQLSIRSRYPLQMTVVQDKTVNAFALPGGHMVIYTGLLDQLRTPEELAALLGHESAHVQERHTLRSMARQLSTYVLLSLLLNDVVGLSAVLLENADQLTALHYSRSLEQAADTQGFLLLKANHLDPKGMQRLFTRLNQAAPYEGPTMLRSHPLTEERLEHVQAMIQQNPYPVRPASFQLHQTWKALQKKN
ncbi:M48 family metallopeptidase [Nibribacter koreensis]|uniref:Peptidase M48 domain-containing protein n=1 Tax=Nibribacter koreensis TaxID=1084519 RepID=A0ABP8G2H3_9BACT